MKNTKTLEMLADYEFFAYSITSLMLHAWEAYDEGNTHQSWSALLAWCEAKDEREKAWNKVRPYYVDAVQLKEG